MRIFRDSESRFEGIISGVEVSGGDIATVLFRPWGSGAYYSKRKPQFVFEWLNFCVNLKHRITNSCQTVRPIRLRKKLCFDDAGPVRQAEKLHRLACDLMVGALLDD